MNQNTCKIPLMISESVLNRFINRILHLSEKKPQFLILKTNNFHRNKSFLNSSKMMKGRQICPLNSKTTYSPSLPHHNTCILRRSWMVCNFRKKSSLLMTAQRTYITHWMTYFTCIII